MQNEQVGVLEVIPEDGWQPENGLKINYNLRPTVQRLQRVQNSVTKTKRKPAVSTTVVLRKLGYYCTSKMNLGVGMFSKVYKALKNGKELAIKVINLKALRKGYAEKFLTRELNCLNGLRHPNICQMFYNRQYLEEFVMIVLEYCPHGDLLNRLIKNGPLTPELGQLWIGQVLDALIYIHSQGIAHRDIKAENVLIYNENQVKLSDFGFACKQSSYNYLSQTFCGSVSYCSPQILSGQPYNVYQTDVWSIGILVYICMTGRMPFFDETDKPRMLRQMNSAEYLFPDTISSDCKTFILTLLTVDEVQRPTAIKARSLPFVNNNDE